MGIGHHQPPHPATPEPRTQSIDQRADFGIAKVTTRQIELLRRHRRHQRHVEADEIIAEPRIERIGQRADAFAQQQDQPLRLAQRRRGIDRQPRHMAIAAEQRHVEAPPAFGAFGEFQPGAHRQRLDRRQGRIAVRQRRGKARLDAHRRRQHARRDRHLDLAEQPRQRSNHVLAKTRRQRRAMLARHRTKCLQPGAAQRQMHGFGGGQHRHRQILDIGKAMFGKRQCRIGGGRHGQPRGQPQPPQAAIEILDQPGLAAIGVRAAGDIEHQPMRRPRGDHRCVAIRTLRQPIEQCQIGGRIMRQRLQIGHQRPGIGEHHPRHQPQGQRRHIERGEPDAAAIAHCKCERRVRLPGRVGLTPHPLA